MRSRRELAYWSLGYLGLVAGVVLALYITRQRVLATMSGTRSQEQWQAWRDDAGQDEGPVRRSVPRSTEPPGLVVMRDHFGGVTVASLLLCSVLYAFMAFVVSGVLRQRGSASPGEMTD